MAKIWTPLLLDGLWWSHGLWVTRCSFPMFWVNKPWLYGSLWPSLFVIMSKQLSLQCFCMFHLSYSTTLDWEKPNKREAKVATRIHWTTVRGILTQRPSQGFEQTSLGECGNGWLELWESHACVNGQTGHWDVLMVPKMETWWKLSEIVLVQISVRTLAHAHVSLPCYLVWSKSWHMPFNRMHMISWFAIELT